MKQRSFFLVFSPLGTITVWDRDQALVWFELKGRSNRISSVQFDSHRLISDGTYSLIVLHDFNVPYGSSDEQFQYDVEYTPTGEQKIENDGKDGEGEGKGDDGKDGNDTSIEENSEDDGTPSATS